MTKPACPHTNYKPWDCGCLYGCDACSVHVICLDCGQPLNYNPGDIKCVCDLCQVTFASKRKLRRHRRAVHPRREFTNGGRATSHRIE